MSLPSFIDKVKVENSINVQSFNAKGANKYTPVKVFQNILSNPSNPDSGKAVVAQAQKGVKLQNASRANGSSHLGNITSMNVKDSGANFKFIVNISKETFSFENDKTTGSGAGVQVALDDNDVWG